MQCVMNRYSYPIRRIFAYAVVLPALACNDAQWDWSGGRQTSPAEVAAPADDSFAVPGSALPADGGGDGDRGGMIVLRIHFDVLRIDLPVDAVRHSLKIWNHIDEALGDPGLTALLARNGFRVGVGRQADWPAIRAVFERNGARVTRVARTVQEGAPLTIPLGQVEDGTSYFLHKRGGGLGGGTLTAGRRVFLIGYALDADDPQRLVLRATPVFEAKRTREKLVERDGEIVAVRDHEGRVFHDLTVETGLAAGEFLVIGGSGLAEKGFVLGSRWLGSALDMQQYETVLCISAQATRIE